MLMLMLRYCAYDALKLPLTVAGALMVSIRVLIIFILMETTPPGICDPTTNMVHLYLHSGLITSSFSTIYLHLHIVLLYQPRSASAPASLLTTDVATP
jgi:hypothetical protein